MRRSQVPRAPDAVPLATWSQVAVYPGRRGGVCLGAPRARAGAHPRTRRPPARLPSPAAGVTAEADGAGEGQRRTRGAREAGGLQPRVRFAVLPPALPPPLPWQPRCLGTREAAAPSHQQPGCGRPNRGGGRWRERGDHQPRGKARGPWAERAKLIACLRMRAGAARCPERTPSAPAQVAAAPEPPRLRPRHARHSHEHQRCQGVSGPEGDPSPFRGRGLRLAEGLRRGKVGKGMGGRRARGEEAAPRPTLPTRGREVEGLTEARARR